MMNFGKKENMWFLIPASPGTFGARYRLHLMDHKYLILSCSEQDFVNYYDDDDPMQNFGVVVPNLPANFVNGLTLGSNTGRRALELVRDHFADKNEEIFQKINTILQRLEHRVV